MQQLDDLDLRFKAVLPPSNGSLGCNEIEKSALLRLFVVIQSARKVPTILKKVSKRVTSRITTI